MNIKELFEKLYTLLSEELALSERDNPGLPEGKIGYKMVRRSYQAKDGTRREYQYRYKYYAYDGKQKYLNRKDAEKVTQVVIVRAQLRMVRGALYAVLEQLNRLLPEETNHTESGTTDVFREQETVDRG